MNWQSLLGKHQSSPPPRALSPDERKVQTMTGAAPLNSGTGRKLSPCGDELGFGKAQSDWEIDALPMGQDCKHG